MSPCIPPYSAFAMSSAHPNSHSCEHRPIQLGVQMGQFLTLEVFQVDCWPPHPNSCHTLLLDEDIRCNGQRGAQNPGRLFLTVAQERKHYDTAESIVHERCSISLG